MDSNQNVPPMVPMEPIQPTVNQSKPGLTEGVWSIILAVLALGFFPPIFGGLAIYLAYRAKKKGQVTLGTVGMALGITFLILGGLIGAYVKLLSMNK